MTVTLGYAAVFTTRVPPRRTASERTNQQTGEILERDEQEQRDQLLYFGVPRQQQQQQQQLQQEQEQEQHTVELDDALRIVGTVRALLGFSGMFAPPSKRGKSLPPHHVIRTRFTRTVVIQPEPELFLAVSLDGRPPVLQQTNASTSAGEFPVDVEQSAGSGAPARMRAKPTASTAAAAMADSDHLFPRDDSVLATGLNELYHRFRLIEGSVADSDIFGDDTRRRIAAFFDQAIDSIDVPFLAGCRSPAPDDTPSVPAAMSRFISSHGCLPSILVSRTTYARCSRMLLELNQLAGGTDAMILWKGCLAFTTLQRTSAQTRAVYSLFVDHSIRQMGSLAASNLSTAVTTAAAAATAASTESTSLLSKFSLWGWPLQSKSPQLNAQSQTSQTPQTPQTPSSRVPPRPSTAPTVGTFVESAHSRIHLPDSRSVALYQLNHSPLLIALFAKSGHSQQSGAILPLLHQHAQSIRDSLVVDGDAASDAAAQLPLGESLVFACLNHETGAAFVSKNMSSSSPGAVAFTASPFQIMRPLPAVGDDEETFDVAEQPSKEPTATAGWQRGFSSIIDSIQSIGETINSVVDGADARDRAHTGSTQPSPAASLFPGVAGWIQHASVLMELVCNELHRHRRESRRLSRLRRQQLKQHGASDDVIAANASLQPVDVCLRLHNRGWVAGRWNPQQRTTAVVIVPPDQNAMLTTVDDILAKLAAFPMFHASLLPSSSSSDIDDTAAA